MNTFELSIRGQRHRFSGPSCYSELTARQAVGILRLKGLVLQEPHYQFVALKLLYGIKFHQQRWLFDRLFLKARGLSPEDIDRTLSMGQDLLDLLLWIGEPDTRASYPVRRFRLYDFQFGTPRIWLGRLLHWRYYYGPSAGLTELSFGEFMFADQAFRAGDQAALAALLYRPRGEAFDRHSADSRTRLFRRADPALLALIEQNFMDSLQLLARYFTNVFSKSEQTATGQPVKAGSQWLQIAINMAKLDVTKIRDIEESNLYLALKVLDEQIRQAEELEQSLQKQTAR